MSDYPDLETASATEILSWALSAYGDAFAIATSFQKEGMVILDLAWRLSRRVRVFTLDTGRLPEETYQMVDTVRERYGIAVELVFPERQEVEQMVGRLGPNLFYTSVEGRQTCCDIRKVRPLERKLRQLQAWATGLRRDQSQTRAQVPKVDRVDSRVKISPLADWTAGQVEAYTERNRLPVHPLYARGYASIGCAPCTRALEAGESGRAGRWWWETDARKECGIHFGPDGLVRLQGRKNA